MPTAIGPEDYFKPGDWNVICSICGTKGKASEMEKNWQGAYRHPKCNEPRHPQDFVRGLKTPEMAVPFAQLDTDTNIVAPAFPASGVNVVNTYSFSIIAYWYPQDIRISQVTVNGVPLAAGAVSATVPPGQAIQFTYTNNRVIVDPPTWMWTGSFQP